MKPLNHNWRFVFCFGRNDDPILSDIEVESMEIGQAVAHVRDKVMRHEGPPTWDDLVSIERND